MQARIRDYEEILILQDKAIEALKQATTVLQQALYVLEKTRAEHGYQNQMPWSQQYLQQPYNVYPYDSGLAGGSNLQMINQNTAMALAKEYYVPETIFKY